MKKKFEKCIKVILIIIAVILILKIIISIKYTKILIGDVKYGKDYCEGHGMIIAGQAFTDYRCNICGRKDMWSNTEVPEICDKCAEDTNRCGYCGELLYTDKQLKEIANSKFGNLYCEGHEENLENKDKTNKSTDLFTSTPKCLICGRKEWTLFYNEGKIDICKNCLEVTGRCDECGKLLK